ncbi:hypothetical protein K503DRAFT_319720 [Rhizopogon vinicolor AM-OR11-026]|uniref:Uncharacterized protein n=1 Tax=Rhizopogon vinicolor AM-OR11-026 TaxID=1314800 RepID=A0A1B7MUG4_9AGAM|nr:hypothetical protein K503DRAFT_319720 [Rhizopogon vinicolor AM-OR11-026]
MVLQMCTTDPSIILKYIFYTFITCTLRTYPFFCFCRDRVVNQCHSGLLQTKSSKVHGSMTQALRVTRRCSDGKYSQLAAIDARLQ